MRKVSGKVVFESKIKEGRGRKVKEKYEEKRQKNSRRKTFLRNTMKNNEKI